MWKNQGNQAVKDDAPFLSTKKVLISLLILISIISINLFLRSDQLSRMMHPIINSNLKKIFGEGVTIGKVSLNLLPTYLDIKDLSAPPLLTARRIRVYFSPLSLITEVFLIKKISIIEPVIELSGYREGSSIENFIIRPRSDAKGKDKGRIIVVRRIDIKNGGARFRAQDGLLEANFKGLDAEIEPDLSMQNYQISTTVKEITLNISGIPRNLAQIEVRAVLHPDDLEIKRFEAGSGDLLFSLMGTISDFDRPRFSLEVRSETGLDKIERLYQFLNGINGRIEVVSGISGKYPDVTMKGHLLLKDLSYNSSRLGDIRSDVFLSKDRFILSNASADIFGGHLTGNITSNISSDERLRYQSKLSFEEIKVEKIKGLIPEGFPIIGKVINGNISLEGIGINKESMNGEGEIKISGKTDIPEDKIDSSWREALILLPEEIQLKFMISGGNLDLRMLRISSGSSVMDVNGSVNKNGDIDLSVQSHIKGVDIKDLLERSGIADAIGSLELAGKVTGNATSPSFRGEINTKDAVLNGVAIDRFSSGVNLTDKGIGFLDAIVETGASSYKFQGRISWEEKTKNPYIDLNVKVNNGSPLAIARIFNKEFQINTPVTGGMSIKGYIKELNLFANLSVNHGDIYGQPVDSGKADIAINNSGITISNILLVREKSILKGKGWIGFDGGFESTLKSDGLSLEDLDMIASRIPNLKGKISFDLSGSGTFDKPLLLGGISINKLSYHGSEIGDGRIDIWTTAEGLNIKAYINNRLTADGKIDLKGNLPIKADINLTEMPIGIFLDFVHPDLPSKVTINTSGKVSIKGDLSRPQSIHTDIHLPNLNMDISGYKMRNKDDIFIQLKGDEAKVVSLGFSGDGTSLNIRGGVKNQGELDFFVEGKAELSLLRLFTKDILLSKGGATLALTISGNWKDPKLKGDLKVAGGMVRSEIVSTQSININTMSLLFNERQILLEKFDGLAGNGSIHGSGRIDIKNMSVNSIELVLELKDVKHALISDFHSSIDGILIFQADKSSRRLTGNINIKRGKYEKRIDMNKWLIEARRVSNPSKTRTVSQDISLNIHFHGRDNIWINNNIAKIPLEVDLYLKGSVTRPVLLGRIEANDGDVFFRGNEFKLNSGRVDFLDQKEIKPQFDIKINAKIRTYQIDVGLVGSLERFNLHLSSNPPLSETDILALLTVGRTTAEFTQTQKEVGREAATSLLVEELIEDKVQKLIGIDRFQVDPYYSDIKASSGPRFTASKKLLDERMYVSYASTLDPSVEQLIEIEYQIGKNISLIGSRDEKGSLGGDIRFRFEFK